jgi:hypothetical protein
MDTQHPVFTSSIHEAGVTSLHSNALFEHLLASGRYTTVLNVHIPEYLVTGHLVFICGFGGGKVGCTFDYKATYMLCFHMVH